MFFDECVKLARNADDFLKIPSPGTLFPIRTRFPEELPDTAKVN